MSLCPQGESITDMVKEVYDLPMNRKVYGTTVVFAEKYEI